MGPRRRGDRGMGIEVVVIDFVSYFERENLDPRLRGDRGVVVVLIERVD